MGLSTEQKKAGRAFVAARQAELDALNEREPAGLVVLALWRVARHPCPDAGGASTGIALREHYAADGPVCFIWKDGRCPACGLVVRSAAGHYAAAGDRPPEREFRAG